MTAAGTGCPRHGRQKMGVYHPTVGSATEVTGISPPARAACFALFAGAGLAILGAVVLLPEYVALARLQARRDALAHQLDCEKRLALYYERTIRAIRTDPDLTTRLMIRHANYRPAGARQAELGAVPGRESVPARLWREAREPPPARQDALVRAGMWLDEPFTQAALVFLSLGLTAFGVMLSCPRHGATTPDTA